MFPGFLANLPSRKRYPWSYIDARELGEYEAPLSNRKAREVLGFREAHDWRKYVKAG